ncbi:hypothetical protein PACTADRAFT_49689 [Pachysolen tannophilus NRRL Y-2460]|uniref:AP complex subunit sigma n=1 Tax=Pachysolen tannophilus NRRL Y-2460 TaxID=669874 RepID=A0A1E4TX57_PACTA|nr:hypothetical protein PACTADRAFT_49689 [Pachysolen tannophilus NRRL Y-2460]
MAIRYIILLSRQGKVRLTKWYTAIPQKDRLKIIRELTAIVLSRRAKMCNVLEYKDSKLIYRRYASLFFVAGIDNNDNELLSLEIIHRYVEQMDKSYGNVCELDIIYDFERALSILDQLIVNGEIIESSKTSVLKTMAQQQQLETTDELDDYFA